MSELEILIEKVNGIRYLITQKGFIRFSLEQGKKENEYVTKINNKFEEFFSENPEVLRSIINLNTPSDLKKISKEDFYFNMWDLKKYYKKNLYEFLQSLYEINQNKVVKIINDEIVVLGHTNLSRSSDDSSSIKDYIYISTSKFVILAYKPENLEELELLKELLTFKYSRNKKSERNRSLTPAIIHCIVVGMKYYEQNIPMYNHFQINKSNGKVRDIYAPKDDVKECLRHLLLPLTKAYNLNKYPLSNQFAYNKKLSIRDNAEVHQDAKFIFKTDIVGFFDNCSWELAEKYLKFMLPDDLRLLENGNKYKEVIKKMIINSNTGGLYQGSPVSGVLSNAILRPAARYLKNIFNKKELNISIYADDITVSSNKPISRNKVLFQIRYVFEYFNLPFKINKEKTYLVSNNKRRIAGVVINHKNEVTVPRNKYRELRAILNNLENNNEITLNKQELMGKISFARYIDDSGKIEALLNKYETVLEKFGIKIKKEYNRGKEDIFFEQQEQS